MRGDGISSGISHLDKIAGGFLVGDNVIWQVESGSFVELFYLNFIRASLKNREKVVFINFNSSPKTVLKRLGNLARNQDLTILDCFTSGKGEKSDLFTSFYEKGEFRKFGGRVIHVDEPSRVSKFIGVINRIEESYPKRTRYVIDSITGIQDLWGSEKKVMKLFTHQCPRLYELQTIAYWILEKGAHSDGFRANLSHISQVVVDLSVENGICRLTVTKADHRSSSEIMKPQRYEVMNSKIRFLTPEKDALDIGKKIKRLREIRAISQADLARKMGVTPSTISQVESNTISLSLASLVRLAGVLNIPLGEFFAEETKTAEKVVFRTTDRKPVRLAGIPANKIKAEELLPRGLTGGGALYLIRVMPGAAVKRHFFPCKGEEIGCVVSGRLVVTIGKESLGVEEGDSLLLKSEVPGGWENKTGEEARLIWLVRRKFF